MNRRFYFLLQSVGNETIVDGDDGNAGLEKRIGVGKTIQAFLGAALPPATMNDKDKGSWFGGLGLPEVEGLVFGSGLSKSNLKLYKRKQMKLGVIRRPSWRRA